METRNNSHEPVWHGKLNTFVTALCFILTGLFFLGRDFGWITQDVFEIFVSWQMLLIVIGLTSLIKRKLVAGLILITIGVYFMLPMFLSSGQRWIDDYWPLLLILIGFAILLKFKDRQEISKSGSAKRIAEKFSDTSGYPEGFVKSDVSFGSSRHIVMEPVFYGADLDASFGTIILDLRHTALEMEQTEIEIDCSFGSIELLVPLTWDIVLRLDTALGAVNDKRHITKEIDSTHKLILHGDVAFGGVEIKN